jgi:hypothetical protein
MNETIKLTSETLHAIGTSNGVGWNRKQLSLLGVKWPPSKGWLKDLIGTEISVDVYQTLMLLRTSPQNASNAKETAKERKPETMSQAEQDALLKRMDIKIAKWKENEYQKRKAELLSKPKNVIHYPKFAKGCHRGKDWYGR